MSYPGPTPSPNATEAALVDESEFPLSDPPAEPLWTENFCFVTVDPETRIGIYSHLGRTAFNRALWRELVAVAMPDGTLLLAKNYGTLADQHVPGGGMLRYRCDIPWQRWRAQFDGAAIRTSRAALESSFLSDGVRTPLEFDLEYEAVAPIWDLSADMHEQSWGDGHYEQFCRVHGVLVVDGKPTPFNGHGLRDHTRGSRDYAGIERFIWTHGVFPDGSGFIALDVKVGDDLLSRAALIQRGAIAETPVSSMPVLTREQPDPFSPVEFSLDGALVAGKVFESVPAALIAPNEVLFGHSAEYATHRLFEGFTRFEWKGQVGWGLTERAFRTVAGD